MLRELGADAVVAPPAEYGARYVVWIGPIASLSDAWLMKSVVKRRFGFLNARIVARERPPRGAPYVRAQE